MVTERRRWRHASDDARKTGGARPSPDRDRAARARSPAVASGTASPSATEAGLAGTTGIHAEQRRGRSRANARISERSEEHTSELQSPCNLVCRLLLEKKKKKVLI